jgi:divalent metal cation (Fe/Co/Zn/Cd) transporter
MAQTEQRDAKVLKVIFVEGLANFTVLGIKLLAGTATGSLAVLGDAVHSLTDMINNVVAWLVTRHSAIVNSNLSPYSPLPLCYRYWLSNSFCTQLPVKRQRS